MSNNPLQPLTPPRDVHIEENYDDPKDLKRFQECGLICYKMSYLEKVTGYASYKRINYHWYIDEFDAMLPGSSYGVGHGTYFLKYLVAKMYEQDEIIIHILASNIKNIHFPQWLINRGFRQDNFYLPNKTNSRILLPCDAHCLWNR
jgi:hypothetical protein